MTSKSVLSRLLFLLPLAALALLAAAPASAQSGVVQGRVLDRAGKAVEYAEVNIEGESNAHVDTAFTAADGAYRFPAVPVGKYTINVVNEGHTYEKIANVTVNPGTSATFDIKETGEGPINEVVIVEGGSVDILDIHETSTSSSVTGEFISTIPLQNKRIQDFVFIFPGVTRNGDSDSTDISIAGGSGSQIGFRLNGLSINDPVGGGANLDVPAASIQSFTVITGGFSAEYGEQSTGIAEIVTKSGTNTLDFTYGLDYKSSDTMYQKLPGLDRSNAFVDELLRAEGTLVEADVERGMRLLGVDPISTTADDNNPVFRNRVRHSVSAGGPIVPDKVWFHTTLESLTDDFGGPFVEGEFDNDQLLWTSKVNWNLWSGKSASNILEFTANVDNDEASGAAFAQASPSVANNQTSTTWTVGATDTHVFNDTTVLETKLGVTHFTVKSRPQDERTGVGIDYDIPLPPGGAFVWTAGASVSSFDTTYDVVRGEASLTKQLKDHTFKGGLVYQTTTFESFDERGITVSDFRVTDDRNVVQGPGRVAGRVVRSGPPTRTTNVAWQANLFLQDTWQITDNLTVDVGMRGDYQSFIGEFFPAPRVGFSLDPIGDKKTRIFGNWGIFHDVLLGQALEHQQRPTRFFDDIAFVNSYTDRRFGQISIADVYKEALATDFNSNAEGAVAYLDPDIEDRFVLGKDISAPTNKDWSIGVERELPGKVTLQVSFRNSKKTHQVTTDTFTVSEAQRAAERTIREIVFQTEGSGEYRHWAVEMQRPVGKTWEVNASYVQSKNVGPIAPPDTPLDPNDVFYLFGPQGNDRTHVVKLQGHGKLFPEKAKLDVSTDFTWQTGNPTSAELLTNTGTRLLPLGRNTLRLPSTRQLNFGIGREFSTADDKLRINTRLNVSNALNQLNVTGGIGRFKVPAGGADPQAFPPLRPTILVTGVDVPRSAEISLSVSF